jgi:aldehyde dehydrogenase
MLYANPGSANAPVDFKAKYDNFIGGKFVAPLGGQYFDVITPITGKPYTQAARSTEADINLALDAAHAAQAGWAATPPAEHCRPHRSQLGKAGLCRDRRQRQADP